MNKKILVVEDEELQRLALAKGLLKAGFNVIEATDGSEGLTIAFREHPDLILTDLHMPKMDGSQMIHSLREDEWGKIVPIIILTNYEIEDNQLGQIAVDYPSYYLMKVGNSLDNIIEKIAELTK